MNINDHWNDDCDNNDQWNACIIIRKIVFQINNKKKEKLQQQKNKNVLVSINVNIIDFPFVF